MGLFILAKFRAIIYSRGQHAIAQGPNPPCLPVFANKVSLEHSHTHSFYTIYDCFCTTMAELSITAEAI